MPLSPADVHNVAFSKPPIGKRGYNEDEVDQFLDLVEDTLAQLQDENDELRAAADSPAAAGVAAKGVDESALRKEIESELRGEYERKLADAKAETARVKESAANSSKSADNSAELRRELESLKKENSELKKENSTLKNAPASATADASGLATPETHMQAARVLGLAQEMADRLTEDARSESESMLSEARAAAEKQLNDADSTSRAQLADAQKKYDTQVAEAENRSRTLVADAEQRAKQLESEANSRAEAQVRQAEEKAASLQQDAERKHTEVMNTVKQQQNALNSRISELRVFEREYRTRLKTLLESQLEELETRTTAAPSEGNNS